MAKKKRSNYKTQEDKNILSSSEESEDSGAETRRQVYFRSRSRSATPIGSPERRKRRRSVSRHRRRSSDRHVRHEHEMYQPSPPSYPRSPQPYQPAPPSYEHDNRAPRYRDDSHKQKTLPRYEPWSGGSKTIRKRCAKDHSVHAAPEVIIIGEKREKRGEEEKRKDKGEKEKRRPRSPKRPRSPSPAAGTGRRTQDEQPPLPPTAQLVHPYHRQRHQ